MERRAYDGSTRVLGSKTTARPPCIRLPRRGKIARVVICWPRNRYERLDCSPVTIATRSALNDKRDLSRCRAIEHDIPSWKREFLARGTIPRRYWKIHVASFFFFFYCKNVSFSRKNEGAWILENLVSSYMEWILRDPLSVYVNSSKFVFGMDCIINTVIPFEKKNKNWLETLEVIWTRFLYRDVARKVYLILYLLK